MRLVPESLTLEDTYHAATCVRSYEAGSNGRISLGTLLRYLEYLATDASAERGYDHEWYERQGTAWVVREMSILLGALPGIDKRLAMATWLSEWRRVQAHREYIVWNPQNGQVVARARGRWAYIDRHQGAPQRIPEEMLTRFDTLGNSMQVRKLDIVAPGNGQVVHNEMYLTARKYEADTNQHINNCVYGDWLTEALHTTVTATSIFSTRTLIPRYYAVEYLQPVLPGDELRIETTIAHAGSRRLMVEQRILHNKSDARIVRARSLHLLLPQT